MATVNKVSCNTSIDAVVMKQARDLKLSPSAVLEEALIKAIKAARYELWCQENQQAIAAHNEKIAEHGTFSEKIQQL
ncbi:type II toxin-antitoxin system CcdA family antitoxin [Paraglaciecola sp.]|uniref:type II toxin-antitoxin system CcdA family antitoxin n=1 Tax=Paraglaciecola sp. TaxID=1920173 RepID=UPI0030F439CB